MAEETVNEMDDPLIDMIELQQKEIKSLRAINRIMHLKWMEAEAKLLSSPPTG